MSSTVDFLVEARDIYTKCGGAKGQTINDAGQICALGAIYRVDVDSSMWPVVKLISDQVQAMFADRLSENLFAGTASIAAFDQCFTISDFNDNPETTKAEVISVFDKAIVAAQELV